MTSDNQPLVREQVIQKRRDRLYGDVVIADRRIWSRSVSLIAFLAVLLGVWAATATYPRTAQVSGLLVSSQSAAKVFATRAGTIDRLYVRDGAEVRKGQRLVFLSVDLRNGDRQGSASSSLAALDRQSNDVSLQLDATRSMNEDEARHLASALQANRSEQRALEGQRRMAEAIIVSMQSAIERLTPVAERGFVSKVEMERRQQNLLSQRQQIEQMAQQVVQLQAKHADLEAQLRQLPLEGARRTAELSAQLNGLAEERSRMSVDVGYTIIAPMDGRVTSLQASEGRTFDSRVPLMTIIPKAAALEAQLYVPTRSVGFIRHRQRVRIMYDSFPYKQFGSFSGTVNGISRASLVPEEIDAALRIEEPVYPVRVTLDSQSVTAFDRSMPLQLGMTLTASVLLEKRSFLDWLLEPLNAVRKRL